MYIQVINIFKIFKIFEKIKHNQGKLIGESRFYCIFKILQARISQSSLRTQLKER